MFYYIDLTINIVIDVRAVFSYFTIILLFYFAVNFKHTAFAFAAVEKSSTGPKRVSRITILKARFPKK